MAGRLLGSHRKATGTRVTKEALQSSAARLPEQWPLYEVHVTNET